VHSASQILALKEWKVGFIKMFNHKPLLVSDNRSLLSYCTVIGDHPFKTSAFFRGGGVKNLPNLPTDSSKKLPTVAE
jgi:hypothetical protein